MTNELTSNIGMSILQKAINAREEPAALMERIRFEEKHAKGTHQWVLTLNPRASQELQYAALLHDIERVYTLKKDGGFQGDRTSPAYQEFKRAHSARSADLAKENLLKRGVPTETVLRTVFLITHHADSRDEVEALNNPDLNTLVTADALDFFNSIAAEILRKEGKERLRGKLYLLPEKYQLPLVK